MDFRRQCGSYYKFCFFGILVMVVLEYDSLTRTIWNYNWQMRRPDSEVFIPTEVALDKLPDLNTNDRNEHSDTLNVEINVLKDQGNVDKNNGGIVGTYDDYELETADVESLDDTADDDFEPPEDIEYNSVAEVELDQENYVNQTLIVLFTSWGYSAEKLAVHKTLLRLWTSWLYSSVRPVVLTNDVNVSRMATSAKWDVLPVSKWMVTCRGPPVLRNLFFDVMEKYDALFYGYANADIIFGNGLVQTLKYLRNRYQWSKTPLLIVGRRYNYDFKSSKVNLSDASDVRKLLKQGHLVIRSTDYFFTNANFPWHKVPMVSIGRPFVVRAVIGFAIKNHYDIIDATKTIESVHLTTADGIYASWNKPGVNCNKHLLIKGHHKLPLGVGHCECAKLETLYTKKGQIRLRSRSPSRRFCGSLK